MIEEPKVDGELGAGAATDQQSSHSTQPCSNASFHPRARSFDHQLSFGIIRDGILERFAFIRVRQEDFLL